MHKAVALLMLAGAAATVVVTSSVASASGYRVVYSFQGNNDGAFPLAGLLNVGGTLFGTTYTGGAYGGGAAFSVNPATGVLTVIYGFGGGDDGAGPSGLINSGGMLYGTTTIGGGSTKCRNGCGTVFALDPNTGAEKVVYAFSGGTNGANPTGNLIGVDGILYGTTSDAGNSTDNGTAFSLNPKTGELKTLHRFGKGNDGQNPVGDLIDLGGKLYGTTTDGGVYSGGTVFSLNVTTGAEKVLHSFGSDGDGWAPNAGLTVVSGQIYGTCELGGSGNDGVVFSLAPGTGAETILYNFGLSAAFDGISPLAGLLYFRGALYGTTSSGGESFEGTVFSVNVKTGEGTERYSFQGPPDGAQPAAGLIKVGSTLYGTTEFGGNSATCAGNSNMPTGCGSIFAIEP